MNMKRLLTLLALTCAAATSFGATLNPVQLLNPTGSTAGQAIVSTGSSSAPAWGNVTATALAAQAANTVIGNATGSSASPTAITVTGCNGAAQALQWTNGSGFGCNSAIATSGANTNITSLNAPALGAATATTAAATTNTTQVATTAMVNSAITGGSVAGAFTTLNASSNDALLYQTTNALSVPTASATTVPTWTKISDRVNANFNASTGTFTAPAAGQYQVSAGLTFGAMTGGAAVAMAVRIVGNGVTLCQQQIAVGTSTTVAQTVTASCLVNLTAAQTIVVQAFQNSGSSVSLAVGSAYNNYLSIIRIP